MSSEYRAAFFIALLMLAAPMTRGEERSGAIVDQVACDAILKDAAGNERPLNKADHAGLYLRSGDSVRCASPGQLTILWGGGEMRVKQSPQNANALAPPLAKTQPEQLASRALQYTNSPAGTRGAAGPLRFPLPGSTVWPETFVIRWQPIKNSGKIRFAVYAPTSSQPLWEDEVDATTVSLDSPPLKQALSTYRDSNPGNANLTLRWSTESSSFDLSFSLLTVDEETALKHELDIWNETTNPLMQAIGRAYSFASRKLHWDAAHAYEAALELAPASCDLLKQTKAEEKAANNWERVDQLERDQKTQNCSNGGA